VALPSFSFCFSAFLFTRIAPDQNYDYLAEREYSHVEHRESLAWYG